MNSLSYLPINHSTIFTGIGESRYVRSLALMILSVADVWQCRYYLSDINLNSDRRPISYCIFGPSLQRGMSAYGSIKRPELLDTLPCKSWRLTSTPDSQPGCYVTTHHLTHSSAHRLTGLLEHLTMVFAEEVDRGLTYPQEGEMDQSTFENYFFAADVFVGIVGASSSRTDGTEAEIALDIDTARAGRSWDECIAGFYYVGSAI